MGVMNSLVYLSGMLPAEDYIRDFRDEEKFLGLCRECPQYGGRWGCPPHGFDSLDYLSGYRYAYVLGVKVVPGRRDHLPEGRSVGEVCREMLEGVRRLIDVRLLDMEREHPGGKAFFAGSCLLCPEGACTRPAGKPCRNPGSLRPSLEALGFDIGRSAAEILGVELRWGKDGDMPEYLVLVSGFFTNKLLREGVWEGLADSDNS